MRPVRLLAVVALAFVLVLSSTQSAFAIKFSVDPTCGPYGTEVTLVVTEFTNYLNVGVAMCSPDGIICTPVPDISCRYEVNGLPTITCVFPAPFVPIMFRVTEGDERASVIFTDCPAVGGVVTPTNTLALVSPWLAVIGVVGCVGAVAIVVGKRRP